MADLSGREKAAVFIASLGPEAASKILSQMDDREIEQMTMDLSSLGKVDSDLRAQIFDEFDEMNQVRAMVTHGGIGYAKELLEKSFGSERAFEILNRLQNNLQEVPFQFLSKADPSQISSFIQDEHPQTIALILAHLDPGISSVVLASLPQERMSDVVLRIATMDRTAPEIVREVERVLERKLATIFSQGFTFAGGVKDVAEILNRVERNTEKAIMSTMEDRDPELAEEIARLMFTFDDIIHVDDTGIQKVLREIETKDLAMALKSANEEVSEKVFKNMSERGREMVKEEIEFMGPTRLKNVEEAQQKIVAIIRRLEDAGDLVISGRGGDADEILV